MLATGVGLFALPAVADSAAVEPNGSMSNVQFIAASVASAQRTQREYNVPASVTIAQAIMESGWGRSGLAAVDKNYFGIKCFNGAPGPIAIGCKTYSTTECLPGCGPATASFRSYATVTDSFLDHAVFLVTNTRYKPAFNYSNDANAFIWQVWKAGYATSPTYYENITSIMRRYNLYQYDLTVGRASIDGDARAELAYLDAAGTVRAFRNVNGLNGFPYPLPSMIVGYGFDPARTFVVDIDGDRRSEILHFEPDGTVLAFRNLNGMAAFPYPQAPVRIGYGFTPATTRFADLDGDGRSEIMYFSAEGTVFAFRNVNGLNGFPYPEPAVAIGKGFDPARTRFANIDGDSRSEIISFDLDGTVSAFRNVTGLTGVPYPGPAATIGYGFDPARTRFADFDGDGRSEIVHFDAAGTALAFRNVNGLTSFPYTAGTVPVGYGLDPARTLFSA